MWMWCGGPLKLFTPKCQVFDGHGDQGKKMSHFAKQALDLWHLRVYLGVYMYIYIYTRVLVTSSWRSRCNMIRQIDYNYKWRILYKTWQERLYSFWMLQALSKSLFSNMDLHTEPVAAIQVQHFKQDVGIQSTDVQERSHGITCSLRMSRGQWTKKPFLRLRFATRRPSQVPSALGASACVHEPNHIGMALWKNQPHLRSSYFFTRIWMILDVFGEDSNFD